MRLGIKIDEKAGQRPGLRRTVSAQGFGVRAAFSVAGRGLGLACSAALVASLAVGLPSCKKDEAKAPSAPEGCFRATASPHSGDGKTELNGKDVLWQDGDRVTVFSYSSDATTFKAAIDEESGGATATLSEENGGTTFEFIPPYWAVYGNGGSSAGITLNEDGNGTISGLKLPQTQQYKKDGFEQYANPMACKSNSNTLTFNNLCGLLKVTLKEDDHGWTGLYKVKSVSIEAIDNETLWGDCSVSFDENGFPSLELGTNGETDSHIITLECSNNSGGGVDISGGGADFYIVMPPAVTLGHGFRMTAVGEDGTEYTRTYGHKTTIGASSIFKMEALPLTVALNLSRYQGGELRTGQDPEVTANCYVVSRPGMYMFPCDVPGNGKAPASGELSSLTWILSNGSKYTITDAGIGSSPSAEVAWQTNNTASTPTPVINGAPELIKLDGRWYIRFSTATPLHDGNALIALKGASGDILWSWHIWAVNTDDNSTRPDNAGNNNANVDDVNGRKWMKWNLGALRKAEDVTNTDAGIKNLTCGLMYQWGRKDPFGGSASLTDGTSGKEMEFTSTGYAPIGTNAISGPCSIGDAVKQPWQFSKGGGDWCSTSTNISNWWTSSSTTNPKSMFDPCPPGWRVPEDGSWVGSYSDGWNKDNFTDGHYVTWTKNGTSYYPVWGYRNSGTLANVGSFGYCWSATPNSNYAYFLHFSGSTVYPSYNLYGRASGFSVRPVQE